MSPSAENDAPVANGHRWPCPGFYNGNHDPIRAGAWSCTCLIPPVKAEKESA